MKDVVQRLHMLTKSYHEQGREKNYSMVIMGRTESQPGQYNHYQLKLCIALQGRQFGHLQLDCTQQSHQECLSNTKAPFGLDVKV
jgi:hypothetical protein